MRWRFAAQGPAGLAVATGLTAAPGQRAGLWHLPGRRLRRIGGLPGGNGRLLERRLQGLRRAAPVRGGRRHAGLRWRAPAGRHAPHLRGRHPLLARPGASRLSHKSYVFMLNAVDDGYGGLEHRNSTALICGRRDLPRLGEAKHHRRLHHAAGLISHEYFHTWNVKRLRRPSSRATTTRQENYTAAAVVLRGFHQLLRRPAAAPRRPDRRRALPEAAEQDHQPGAADARGAPCSRWRRPALTPGSSTTARTRTRPTPPSATTPRARWWRCAWT
jgi:hypothetical protein